MAFYIGAKRRYNADIKRSPAPQNSAPTTESTAPEGPVELTGTLKVSLWDLATQPAFSAVIDAFKDANPGVTIEPIDIPSADYGTKLSVMLNGGSDVDVFWIKDADTMIDKINKGESNLNWGIATLPHPEGVEAGYVVGSTTPIAINEASPNKDLAWEFVKFVCGPEGAKIVADLGGVPAMLDDATLKVVAGVDGMPEGALEALQVKNITLDRPIADKVSEVNQMLGEQHSLIMLGESDLDTVLADMAEQSKSIQG